MLALDFPPVSHLIEWPDLIGSGPFAVNKVVLLMWLAVVLTFVFFLLAARKAATGLVPSGVQNAAEAVIDFVRNDVILQGIGPDGMRFLPFLVTVFIFVFVCNVFEIIPVIQMPVTARMAIPMFLALVVFVTYNAMGIAKQGLFTYLKNIVKPPGVPIALLPLIGFIEFISTIFVRPFALAVRLFANMLAGHLLLVSFAVITASLWSLKILVVIWPVSLALLIGLTAFEVLVAVLQAFIFTILTAVYIGGAMHPEH